MAYVSPMKITPAAAHAGKFWPALAACLSLWVPIPQAQAQKPADWLVPGATVRYTLRLADAPTHGSAGYFVNLPDGGILPGPVPVTTVVRAAEGKVGEPEEIESRLLWHNKESGMSVVFADPGGKGLVHVYVSGRDAPVLWGPDSAIKPSAVLCVDPTQGTLEAAKALAARGTVGTTVHARNKAGLKQAPFSIGGDESGRPRPGSFYLLAHVVTADPGKTWIAPFTVAGEGEVWVDGKRLELEDRIDKWGGTGAYVELGKDPHRVEVFHALDGTGPYASDLRQGGLMYLTWRTPKATMAELGGVRSDKVPMPGTSRMETRVLHEREITRSGSCTLERIDSQSGVPVASVHLRPTFTYWFEGEAPLIIYELEPLASGHPEGTRYTWSLPGGVQVSAPKLRWIFPGFLENKVALAVENDAGRSESVRPFFGFSTVPTSLDNPEHREAFRAACAEMLKAYPTDPDPAASWGDAIWNNVIRTTEMGAGFPLLEQLFTTRWPTVQERLTPAQVSMLQNVYIDMAARRNAEDAAKVVDGLIAASEGTRRDELMLRKAELLMYYLGKRELAEAGLMRLAGEEGEMGEWARIRLGDIAFLNGDLNRATLAYADVENRAREKRNRGSTAVPDGLVTSKLLEPAAAPDPKAEIPDNPPEQPADGGDPEGEGKPANVGVGALLDVSISENVDNLIKGGYLLEAHQALRGWEREFPLSKLSGDFILLESQFYMKLADYGRVRMMLESYCRQIDASSFLPDATRLLIECAKKADTPPAEIRDIIEKVSGNLKFHPVAEELEAFLSANPKDK